MHRKTTSPLRSHGRYEYSAITKRPDYSWPGRKRLAVYVGFNLEHFSFGEGMGAALGPRSPEPEAASMAAWCRSMSERKNGKASSILPGKWAVSRWN